MTPIFIYGSGAFGTSLALSCLHITQPSSPSVTLISRQSSHTEELERERLNKRYLPNFPLPESLILTSDISCLSTYGLVLLACPAQSVYETVCQLKEQINPESPVVICAKGIDCAQLKLLSTIVSEVISNPLAVLSGPSFAQEIAKNLPTAVVIASEDESTAVEISDILRHSRFRCYASSDEIGVQIGGALKNVLAIACGIVEGKQLGCNAKSALLTRGLAEMQRLGISMGAQKETFLGLAGVGDLTLTSSSHQSRNFTLGVELGQGRSLTNILSERKGVTEGIATAQAVMKMAEKENIRMPICESVYKILHEEACIDQVIEDILSFQSNAEF